MSDPQPTAPAAGDATPCTCGCNEWPHEKTCPLWTPMAHRCNDDHDPVSFETVPPESEEGVWYHRPEVDEYIAALKSETARLSALAESNGKLAHEAACEAERLRKENTRYRYAADLLFADRYRKDNADTLRKLFVAEHGDYQADLAALREALEPFAKFAQAYEGHPSSSPALLAFGESVVFVADFLRAQAVLLPTPPANPSENDR